MGSLTLSDLRRAVASATPGEWRAFNCSVDTVEGTVARVVIARDAALIAAAVNHLPALLRIAEAAEAQTALLDEWNAKVNAGGPWYGDWRETWLAACAATRAALRELQEGGE